LLLSILLGLVSLFILVQVPFVQTWAAVKASNMLSDELGTTVSIGKFKFKFFDRIELEDIYVADLHNDTLLYVQALEADFDDVYLNFKHFDFKKVLIRNGQFNVRQFQGEEDLNIQFILDALKGEKDSLDTIPGTPPALFFWKVELENFDFTYEYRDSTLFEGFGIDFENFRIRDINASLNKLLIIDDSLSGEIKGMRFKEASGFEVLEMNTNFSMSYTAMELSRLFARTEKSSIEGKIRFDYDSYDDLSSFITNVHIRSRFRNTTIHTDDLAYFSSELLGLEIPFTLSGHLFGTIDDFKGRNIYLGLGENTWYSGNFQMDGLPNIESTLFDLDIKKLNANAVDLELLKTYPFVDGVLLQLPPEIHRLGNMQFTGKLLGNLDDFYAKGAFNSTAGNVELDCRLAYDEKLSDYVYRGAFITEGFQISTLFPNQGLPGDIAANLKIEGQSFNPDKLVAELVGEIERLEYNDYYYQGIRLNGRVSKNKYDGEFHIIDPNVRLDFRGFVDLSGFTPDFNFHANINYVNLTSLGLIQRDSVLSFQAEIFSEFRGGNLDDFEGTIEIENSIVAYGNKKYRLDDILIESSGKASQKMIEVYSDLADGKIEGKVSLETLQFALSEELNRILPSYNTIILNSSKAANFAQDFKFDFKIKDLSLASALFFPSVSISRNTILKGNFTTSNHQLKLGITSPQITSNDIRFVNILANVELNKGIISSSLSTSDIFVSDSISIEHANVQLNGVKDSIFAEVGWASRKGLEESNATLNLSSVFTQGTIDIQVMPSLILLGDTLWQVNEDNGIHFDSTGFLFKNLSFEHFGEFVRLDGQIGSNPDYELDIVLDNFNLDNFDPLLQNSGVKLGGTGHGIVSISDVYGSPFFKSDLRMKKIMINDDLYGDGEFLSKWNSLTKSIQLNGALKRGSNPSLLFSGNYTPSKKENNIDLDVNIQNFNIEIFESYVSSLFTDLSGFADGSVKITGTIEKPIAQGKLFLKRTAVKVGLLNTTYSFTHEIEINQNSIDARNVILSDAMGNTASMDFKMRHTFFSDISLDMTLNFNKIHALNTTEGESDLFYGTAYATGRMRITGPLENLNIQIDAKTEKGTIFNLPLTGTGEVSQQDFIVFESKKDTTRKVKPKRQVSTSKGFELRFNLEVTPDAEAVLVFDPKVGDLIRGFGEGNLRLEVTEAGVFNIFGDYKISSGDYLFTLQNVINKKFVVQRGGTISFKGDPYNADIDITAIYRVRTSLYNLISSIDSSSANNQRRVIDVDAIMHLRDKLMKPTITFDIQLPNSDEGARNLLRSQIINEDDLNKQVFSLVMFKSFWPNTGGANDNPGAGGLGSNASELISNQLSNMLNQLSTDVNVGFNYKQSDAASGEEVNLNLSTQLLNDRITIDGNVGVMGNASSTENTSNMVGEFNIEVRVNEEGTVLVRVFNRSNQYLLLTNDVPYTQGVGLFYRKEFDSLNDLFSRPKKSLIQ